ncbi:RagB/SusD family nutrient uptake outer membrane protein [Sphingobacterium faecale]|uniref:RagB/SusD family nutrient uptake outer membrane protein n=1 Tax=Sphingobacterium faecale TaxID=2803775 RepID=A0ABS1R3Z7_9SPHI|nr:RagB/SusD family nutrient uptake outer membrane protein [Sphingobacterium faecale]MBL1409429.1 RagB/SusD family nutrient uptake outer membrane protein [Sphingobacterium faecale]
MKKLKRALLILPLAALSLSSCDKWLAIKPADRIVEENVFNSEAGFLSALNGVYTDLTKSDLYGSALSYEFIEILAQQYSIRAANTDYTETANYSYTSKYTKERLEKIWDASFKTILNCNKIIENGKDKESLIPSKSLALFIGESLALRSFLHFDMLRLFGPIYKNNSGQKSIPYINHISVSASPLLTAEEAAHQILADLDRSESLLKSSDPIIAGGPQTDIIEDADNTERFRTLRFNYYAVLALKARVYLYIGDKPNALKYAKMIINDPNRETYFPFVKHTEILGNSTNTDRVFSTEVLFAFYTNGRNDIFQRYFNPESATASSLLIPRSGNIATLFAGEENDYRNYPIWKNSSLEANAVYSSKHKKGETVALYRNNIMPLLRLSELYLIAAEAESSEQQAYVYLNKLRNQRGLGEVSNNLTARLRSEYTKEFFGEGQLFFYYKRNNITPLRSGISNNNITMTPARYTPLLPDSENRYRD